MGGSRVPEDPTALNAAASSVHQTITQHHLYNPYTHCTHTINTHAHTHTSGASEDFSEVEREEEEVEEEEDEDEEEESVQAHCRVGKTQQKGGVRKNEKRREEKTKEEKRCLKCLDSDSGDRCTWSCCGALLVWASDRLVKHIYPSSYRGVVSAGEGLLDFVTGGNSGGGDGDGGTFTINHSMGLVSRLAALLEQGNNSDVTLRLETVGTDEVRVIRAHSLVLALQSNVFEELLRNRTTSSTSTTTTTTTATSSSSSSSSSPTSSPTSTRGRGSETLVIRESAESVAAFDKFIRYLYSGELAVRLDQATTLHLLATKYNVSMLRQGLSQFMSENLASEAPSSRAVRWYEYAVQSGDEALRDSCLRYLTWNLTSALRSRDWPEVSAPLLLTLLQRSDLVLHSELELFEAVEAWLERQDPDGLTAENALRSIRYAMMAPRELFRLQRESGVLQRYAESVRDLLFMSYQFHSASPLQLAKFFDVNCSLFAPRNYLGSAWGVPWVIGSPARDDRSVSFQTQLGPSGHDAGKRVTWNALFSPRWLPLSLRPPFSEQGAMQPPPRPEAGRPRVIVTPATSSADMAGVSFQKTLLVVARLQGGMAVRHVYNFHQSTEESGDFLAGVDLQRRNSDYLPNGSLHLHIIIKPLYQSLIATKN
ncbi:hypothetical protein ACEWY4_026081 [Coilia grayii]|uniref:BTB domain-containing protein n=1 Tax=Coilia grayii TaxID=363190 RepID=A0ABD1IWU0_9TELE